MNKKIVVISGPNLVDGGPISVFYDFLDSIIRNKLYKKYIIYALVSKRELFKRYEGFINLIEFRKSKKNWVYRLYYEYVYFYRLSVNLNVYLWISMHDITPNVHAKYLYTYCHNPSPFNKMPLKDARFGVKYYLFSKFYKYLYAINIHRTTGIIVQQEWMRNEFIKMYKIKNIIVARPSLSIPNITYSYRKNDNQRNVIFLYPSFPRYYKNFEVCCKAATLLYENNIRNFKLFITLDGRENGYSRYLYKKYHNIQCIEFCGLLKRKDLFDFYSKCDCLLFTSKLETWGMPITEFEQTMKPMIVSNMPYAHETVGNYDNVSFVSPDNYKQLSKEMEKVIEGKKLGISKSIKVEQPYAMNWDELCSLLFK